MVVAVAAEVVEEAAAPVEEWPAAEVAAVRVDGEAAAAGAVSETMGVEAEGAVTPVRSADDGQLRRDGSFDWPAHVESRTSFVADGVEKSVDRPASHDDSRYLHIFLDCLRLQASYLASCSRLRDPRSSSVQWGAGRRGRDHPSGRTLDKMEGDRGIALEIAGTRDVSDHACEGDHHQPAKRPYRQQKA